MRSRFIPSGTKDVHCADDVAPYVNALTGICFHDDPALPERFIQMSLHGSPDGYKEWVGQCARCGRWWWLPVWL
ncbi:MAG TPA: hypothetical protein VGN17_28415 [Bryobacteraceae bacterium]|jgi:hypothetical protein